MSANLLQAQTDCLGALNRIDELALAYSLFNDVAKVFKVLEKNRKRRKRLPLISLAYLIHGAD